MYPLRSSLFASLLFSLTGCAGDKETENEKEARELAESACSLFSECEPETFAVRYDSEDDCLDDLSEELLDNYDTKCGKSRNALVQCAVDTFEQECQPDFSVHCNPHVLVCASPSTNDWACTEQENEMYFDCLY